MRQYRFGLVFAVSLSGVSAASDTLEEAQDACRDIEDYERCHGLCVYSFQHNGITDEYEGKFWEEARDCAIVPQVVVTEQRPAESGIEWPEWDTLEDLGHFYSYPEWVSHWSAQTGDQNTVDPNRPEELEDAINDALRCMLDPDSSAIARFHETVRIGITDSLPEGKGAAYYCDVNYMVIDKGNLEEAVRDFQGTYRVILLTALMHEFIHVEHHRRYGCPSWENPNFAPSTGNEEEWLTIDKTWDEYVHQIGVRSPLDPAYDPFSEGIIGCPGEDIRE